MEGKERKKKRKRKTAGVERRESQEVEEDEILMLPGHRQRNVQKMPHMEVSWG